jgi:hypothetical protein
MYTLLKPIHGGLALLVQEVEDHIKTMGMEAVRNLKGDNVSFIIFTVLSYVKLKVNVYLDYNYFKLTINESF